ncbi:hypothetical protein [Actinoplanes sp. NPDC089786]|uniref:hypothetical protein n=1 Tax=Actinoplanes sp. NPDC089786 TaxID=3155185 RepID=UPI003446FA69
MAKSSKVAERATIGIVLVIVAVLLWFADQRRLATFVALALFVPYLALIAPFKCGGYTRQRQACRLIGSGLLLGCHHHRFDRIGRIFGHDRDRAAARYRYPDRSVQAASSTGIPGKRPSGEPSRLRGFDMLSLAISVSSMIAGWLALWIGPS